MHSAIEPIGTIGKMTSGKNSTAVFYTYAKAFPMVICVQFNSVAKSQSTKIFRRSLAAALDGSYRRNGGILRTIHFVVATAV